MAGPVLAVGQVVDREAGGMNEPKTMIVADCEGCPFSRYNGGGDVCDHPSSPPYPAWIDCDMGRMSWCPLGEHPILVQIKAVP